MSIESEKLTKTLQLQNLMRDPTAVLALISERDQLKAESEALRKYGEEFSVLAERRREEVEKLRKALANARESVQREYWDEYAGLEETRAIIDAAMGKGEQS